MVVEQGGCLNEGPILLHYVLRVSVYDTASRNTVTFQIAAYFKNGRHFPTLSLHTAVFITGQYVFGVTKDNPIRLAVLIEDVHFLPVSGRSSSGNPGSGGGGGKGRSRIVGDVELGWGLDRNGLELTHLQQVVQRLQVGMENRPRLVEKLRVTTITKIFGFENCAIG